MVRCLGRSGVVIATGIVVVLVCLKLKDVAAFNQKQLQPNEAGQIMVLMYHGIGKQEATWTRSRDNFLKDLEILYQKGYRPISLRDLVHNRISTEAGYTPVVLTFDDGRPNNFRVVVQDGEPVVKPDCAVGILEQFHKEHPDFPLEATFFLWGKNPFDQPKWLSYKLNYLVSRGMDVGNHSTRHRDLAYEKNLNAAKIQRYLGAQAAYLESQITEHPDYRVDTHALCYGHRPRKARLRKYLVTGAFDGKPYRNDAIVNVGSGPVHSPAVFKFNPRSIPRIRASQKHVGRFGIRAWIRHFDNYPGRRYISDGDPNTVSVPSALSKRIDPAKLGGARLVVIGKN